MLVCACMLMQYVLGDVLAERERHRLLEAAAAAKAAAHPQITSRSGACTEPSWRGRLTVSILDAVATPGNRYWTLSRTRHCRYLIQRVPIDGGQNVTVRWSKWQIR